MDTKGTMKEMLRERKSRRDALGEIKESMLKLDNPFLSSSDLEKLHIQRFPMALEGEQVPIFFRPYQGPIEEPDIDTPLGYSPRFSHDQEIGRSKFGTLYDSSGIWWRVEAAWTTTDKGLPHMKLLMSSHIVGNEDRFFRGELLAIINVMVARIKARQIRPHIIAPILLFSIVGLHHVRVLEAHFNGKQLVVRVTKLYNMEKKDTELLRLLSSWWLGHPSEKSTVGPYGENSSGCGNSANQGYPRETRNYLQICPSIVPTRDDWNQPTIRHPDLSPSNVFIDDSGEITGIIDWKRTEALPMFLQARMPAHFQDFGDGELRELPGPKLAGQFRFAVRR
ncbi:hypothetical protein VTO42DRAFT_4933 [Malbranchea cinnamomea]